MINVNAEERAGRSNEVYEPRRRENKRLAAKYGLCLRIQSQSFSNTMIHSNAVAFLVREEPAAAIDQ